MSRGLGITLAVVAVLLLVVLMVFGSFISARNQMVAKDQIVKSAWSEVEVQLERRADLISQPGGDREGLHQGREQRVWRHRKGSGRNDECPDPGGKIAANGQLDSALAKVLVLTENYPQLRSSDQFMRLQDELSGTENRISVARKRYNDALQDYNTFVLQFPNNIWAGIAGFHQNNAYFTASPAAQTPPTVSF